MLSCIIREAQNTAPPISLLFFPFVLPKRNHSHSCRHCHREDGHCNHCGSFSATALFLLNFRFGKEPVVAETVAVIIDKPSALSGAVDFLAILLCESDVLE